LSGSCHDHEKEFLHAIELRGGVLIWRWSVYLTEGLSAKGEDPILKAVHVRSILIDRSKVSLAVDGRLL
jgi:hypothetical protein